MREFAIRDRLVGFDHPAYVIAEVGANHNRDLGLAKQLIDVALEAGADAVKFQTYSGDTMYSRHVPPFDSLRRVTDKAPRDLIEEIALPREWQPELAEYATKIGIHFFSTPFDHAAVQQLAEIDVPLLKIASFELVDLPLIRAAAATGRPLLISTGMATLAEIDEALRAAQTAGAPGVGLMQCTSIYPAAPELINLRAMHTMQAAFGVPVGFSDHTTGTAAPIAAAALGASFIEKHVTLDRTMPGPDHSFALEPHELRQLVSDIREAEAALGDGTKSGPIPEEQGETYENGRRSLVLTQSLPRGTVLEPEMVTTKRPGWGIAPRHLEIVLGRELRTDAEADDVLTWDMI